MDHIDPISVPRLLIGLTTTPHIAQDIQVTVKGIVQDLTQMQMDVEYTQGNVKQFHELFQLMYAICNFRSTSITEDGVTTRFREESREPSVKRDSISRDSGISSIRESSVLDFPRRESSLTRGDRLSTASVIESVAELRNKYSPANYVPACQRKNENISRSKSINDIGE